jgi:RimJ/RimL family protein N-acetyltransferase
MHTSSLLPIATERLILRKYRYTDIPDIVAYSSHPSIAEEVNWKPTRTSVKKYIKKQECVYPEDDPKWLDLAMELKAEHIVMGTIGIGIISRDHRQGIVGWGVGIDYRCQGYATEAACAIITFGFTHMHLHKIIARSDALNVASWKLMEKIGMKREAHFRHHRFQKGEWRDKFEYAILKEEWNVP